MKIGFDHEKYLEEQLDFPGVDPEPYEVLLFGPSGQQTFSRFLGAQEI